MEITINVAPAQTYCLACRIVVYSQSSVFRRHSSIHCVYNVSKALLSFLASSGLNCNALALRCMGYAASCGVDLG